MEAAVGDAFAAGGGHPNCSVARGGQGIAIWSLAPYAEPLQGEPWQLSLAGERQEVTAAPSPVDHSLKLTFSTLF